MGEKERERTREQEELSSADFVIFINKLSFIVSYTFPLSVAPLCFSKLLVFTVSVYVLNY